MSLTAEQVPSSNRIIDPKHTLNAQVLTIKKKAADELKFELAKPRSDRPTRVQDTSRRLRQNDCEPPRHVKALVETRSQPHASPLSANHHTFTVPNLYVLFYDEQVPRLLADRKQLSLRPSEGPTPHRGRAAVEHNIPREIGSRPQSSHPMSHTSHSSQPPLRGRQKSYAQTLRHRCNLPEGRSDRNVRVQHSRITYMSQTRFLGQADRPDSDFHRGS